VGVGIRGIVDIFLAGIEVSSLLHSVETGSGIYTGLFDRRKQIKE
jgi:hypothetical protein